MTGPIGRRQFVASAGGTLFCTLAGQRLSSNSHVDIEKLGGGIPVPPKVAAYYNAQSEAHPDFVSDTRPRAHGLRSGQTRTGSRPSGPSGTSSPPITTG